MGRFRVLLYLPNGQRHPKIIIAEKTKYSTTSKERMLIKLDFTEANFGIKLIYDEIDTGLADMYFSKVKKIFCFPVINGSRNLF